MELKDFIKTAITDIVSAVQELQTELTEMGALVNPVLSHPVSNSTIDVGKGNEPIQQLTFDVALTTSESATVDGGAKGGVAIFAAKIESAQQAGSQNVSRLSFAIPVVLPTMYVKTTSERFIEDRQMGLRKLRAEIDSEYSNKS